MVAWGTALLSVLLVVSCASNILQGDARVSSRAVEADVEVFEKQDYEHLRFQLLQTNVSASRQHDTKPAAGALRNSSHNCQKDTLLKRKNDLQKELGSVQAQLVSYRRVKVPARRLHLEVAEKVPETLAASAVQSLQRLQRFLGAQSKIKVAGCSLVVMLVLVFLVDAIAACMPPRMAAKLRSARTIREKLRSADTSQCEEPRHNQLPMVCPSYLELPATGATLTIPLKSSFTWRAAVSGIGGVLPDSPRLEASLQWAKRDRGVTRVLQVSALGPGGPEVLVSCTSSLEIELAGGEPFGCLKMMSTGRFIVRDTEGNAMMVLSCDHGFRNIEMATLPKGMLVATGCINDECLEICTKQTGEGVIFALACALAVLTFVPARGKSESMLGSTSPPGLC